MKLSYQDRIAFYFLITTAAIVAVLLVLIYSMVKTTVYTNLDNDLDFEAQKHMQELVVEDGYVQFANKNEWLEREHKSVEVNPVFIQITDKNGKFYDKSPNLKLQHLFYRPEQLDFTYYNTELNGKSIRQVQVPVYDHGKLTGYLLLALVLENAQMVLQKLKQVMLIAFPVVMIILFFMTRYMAGQSILPVKHITDTARKITHENLNERISLPVNQDELHTLSVTINHMLNRMENMIHREKQFTADASHQLRTPLAVMKGTLEVLIRKPRLQQEYEEKVAFCVQEIDRMSHMVEQLLLLARFDSDKTSLRFASLDMPEAIEKVLRRMQLKIQASMISIDLLVDDTAYVYADPDLLDVILENILSNAIKYSPEFGSIEISIRQLQGQTVCTFSDHGQGISQEALPLIFDRFYRADTLYRTKVEGSGLGLAIVNRMCDLMNIQLDVRSVPQQGTQVTMTFASEITS